MLQKNDVAVGDLVLRDNLLFLVVQIGWDYQEGFALCQQVNEKERHFWIMQSLLCPLPSNEEVA